MSLKSHYRHQFQIGFERSGLHSGGQFPMVVTVQTCGRRSATMREQLPVGATLDPAGWVTFIQRVELSMMLFKALPAAQLSRG